MKKNLLGLSLITISGLYILLSAIIILICILTDAPVLIGIGISIVILVIQFLISPWLTDLSMRWFYKVNWNFEIPEYLKDFINGVCKDNNMKTPRIGFIDDGAPNAFTYGRTKNDSRVVITRGIIELLSEEEQKAVIAHELGHATHYDMLFMTVAQLVPLVMYGIYELCSQIDNDSDNKASEYASIIAVIAYVLYIVSNYIVLWLSRTREYYADYFACEVTKNPNALAEALVKVGFGLSTSSSNTNKKKAKNSAGGPAALGIFDSKSSKSLVVNAYSENGVNKENIKGAMKWEMWNVWATLYELNSTHPLISKRLIAISNISAKYGQEPYICFDLEKPESYVDDFFKELLISIAPWFSFVVTLIVLFVVVNSEKTFNIVFGLGVLLFGIFSLLKYKYTHSTREFNNSNVSSLLQEVKVSGITSIPCTLEGNIIGRGNPGCILNEDFVIKDETGIILLDYNQPLNVINKIFALFKSESYFDKNVKVTGWYRRSPVPYVELLSMEVDGKVKKIHTYKVAIILRAIVIAIGLFLTLIAL